MKKVRKGNEIIEIDCDDNVMCGKCSFMPIRLEQKCKFFDVLIDHVVGGSTSNSGWKRCPECIDAEVI